MGGGEAVVEMGEVEELAELHEDILHAGAKRSRLIEKEAKFEAFKKQQRLHPEFSGIYADTFLCTPRAVDHFQELLVFSEDTAAPSVRGALQLEPHTTVRELRQMLFDELSLPPRIALAHACHEPLLPRKLSATERAQLASRARCAILPTQNHKLAYPFFLDPSHVLVVRRLAVARRPRHDADRFPTARERARARHRRTRSSTSSCRYAHCAEQKRREEGVR